MLTPQEVNNKTFPKAVIGGYTMAAVDDFLDKLTDDYTSLYKENAALKTKIKVLAEKMEESRQNEESFRTLLLSAKKMADEIIASAESKRDEIVKEAESKRGALMGDAENAAKARILELRSMVEQENQRLAEKRKEVDEAVAAEEYRLERVRSAVEKFAALSRSSCEEQLQILSRLEEAMPPAPERSSVENMEEERFTLPLEETVSVEETNVPPLHAEIEEMPVVEENEEPEDVDTAYTSPLPSLSSLKNLLKRGHHGHREEPENDAEPVAEGEDDDLLSAMSALSVEEDEDQESLFTSASEEETRVINLDDLQFGRNYNREN